jgi:hypothetical protein
MLMIAGILGVMRGIAATAEDEVFLATPDYVSAFTSPAGAGST